MMHENTCVPSGDKSHFCTFVQSIGCPSKVTQISFILNNFCPKATGQTGSQVSDTGPLVLRLYMLWDTFIIASSFIYDRVVFF